MVYASRGSIVFLALIIAIAWIRRLINTRMTPGLRAGIIASIGIVAALVVLGVTVMLQNATAIGYVIQRFASIGNEPGSLGRLTLWTGGIQVFQHYPLGVGPGNAIAEVQRELGVSLTEDNLHNVFLQHLVDAGIQGFFAYLLFCIMVSFRIIRDRFRNPLLLFAGIYLIAGAIQFRGVDAIFWFVYGIEMGATTAPWRLHSNEEHLMQSVEQVSANIKYHRSS